jgi:hypothetical protein
MPEAVVLVFAKAPQPGRVKTRLIPAIGADGAAALHERLVRETLARICGQPGLAVELWCAPDPGHALFAELARAHALTLRRQCEGDLGARLWHAAARALRDAPRVLLVGSDCPELDGTYLREAAALLCRPDTDAVLGPAVDGGYVLLGLKRAEVALFTGMPWGSDRVAALTRERMQRLDWRWRELPALRDVDRPEDLRWYREARRAP